MGHFLNVKNVWAAAQPAVSLQLWVLPSSVGPIVQAQVIDVDEFQAPHVGRTVCMVFREETISLLPRALPCPLTNALTLRIAPEVVAAP